MPLFSFRFHVLSFSGDGDEGEEQYQWTTLRTEGLEGPEDAARTIERSGRTPMLVCSDGGDVYSAEDLLDEPRRAEPLPGYRFVPLNRRINRRTDSK